MDIYDSSYFRINKQFLMLVGLWPFDSRGKKFLSRFIFGGALAIMMVPQMIGLYLYTGKDTNRALLNILAILYTSAPVVKMAASILSEKKLKTLYCDIATNFQMIKDVNEKKKLIQHSQKARYITIYILIYFVVGDVSYICIPLAPMILNYIKPLNESRPKSFVLQGEFFVDSYEHYKKIFVFDMVTLTVTLVVVGSVDTMYAASVEHCVGLFAILKYRLRMPIQIVHSFYSESHRDPDYDWMVATIRLHNKILLLSRDKLFTCTYVIKITINEFLKNTCSFKDTVETSFSTSFLILISVNMFSISIISVLILLNPDKYFDLVRYAVLLFGLAMHLFYLSWPGQQLVDYSSGLFRDAYLNEWYDSSERSKKLLRIMTLRCAQPCQITAGGLYVMNFQNFALVIKTSVSYITVFSSVINREQ